MSNIKVSKIPPFGLRLMPKLKRSLDAVASANGRSLNAEITERLEWSLAAEKDFADYRAKADDRSKLAARRLLDPAFGDQSNPTEGRLRALEDEVAAIKAKLGM